MLQLNDECECVIKTLKVNSIFKKGLVFACPFWNLPIYIIKYEFTVLAQLTYFTPCQTCQVPETTCSVVKIPVPSQAKLHKQWCLFDQACFHYFRIVLLSWRRTVNLNKLLSAKATSTLTEKFARSQALWQSRRSMIRRFMYCIQYIQYIHSYMFFLIFYIYIYIHLLNWGGQR